MSDYYRYFRLTITCIRAGSICTPRLQEELSFQALYRAFKVIGRIEYFWDLTWSIIEVLHHRVGYDYLHRGERLTHKCQNLLEKFPRLITDFLTVCFEAFHEASLNDTLTLLVYEALYPHILQVEASNPASAFPLIIVPPRGRQIRGIITRVVTLHPQRHRLELTGRHYALVAWFSLEKYLDHSR